MKRRALCASFAVLALGIDLPTAVADEDEHRLSAAGAASLVSLDAYGTSDTTIAYGGTVGAAWGIRNWLDLGIDATYLVRPNTIFSGAAVDGVGGPGFELYANLHDVRLAGHARLILDGGPFYRVRPVAGVRAGVGVRFLASPELFDSNGGFVLAAGTDTTVALFAGGDAGVTWRVSKTLQLAILATATFAADAQVYGLQLELSWFSYDWF